MIDMMATIMPVYIIELIDCVYIFFCLTATTNVLLPFIKKIIACVRGGERERACAFVRKPLVLLGETFVYALFILEWKR